MIVEGAFRKNLIGTTGDRKHHFNHMGRVKVLVAYFGLVRRHTRIYILHLHQLVWRNWVTVTVRYIGIRTQLRVPSDDIYYGACTVVGLSSIESQFHELMD